MLPAVLHGVSEWSQSDMELWAQSTCRRQVDSPAGTVPSEAELNLAAMDLLFSACSGKWRWVSSEVNLILVTTVWEVFCA